MKVGATREGDGTCVVPDYDWSSYPDGHVWIRVRGSFAWWRRYEVCPNCKSKKRIR